MGARATVITDASFYDVKNKHVELYGGWAAWVRVDRRSSPITGYGPIRDPRMKNSTHAELFATLNGVWLANRYGGTDILIRSDCMAVVDCVNRHMSSHSTMSRLWLACLKEIGLVHLMFRAEHVKGHGEIKCRATWVNDWCDTHAKKARTALMKGKICSQISSKP
jgi:ribonuclease HI